MRKYATLALVPSALFSMAAKGGCSTTVEPISGPGAEAGPPLVDSGTHPDDAGATGEDAAPPPTLDAGTADATGSCTTLATSYDRSCTTAADCVSVPLGTTCTSCAALEATFCQRSAINSGAESAYAIAQDNLFTSQAADCDAAVPFCPADPSQPQCVNNLCVMGSGDAGDAGVDAGSVGGDAASEPIFEGAGAACNATSQVTIGTKIVLDVTWPASSAVTEGSGQYFIWLLSVYNVDGANHVVGTTTTCGIQIPAITLSSIGAQAMNVPSGTTGQQETIVPPTSWNGVPAVNITGTLGGWNVGSSFALDPFVTLYGIAAASPLADGTTVWPTWESAIVGGLTYADGGAYQAGVGQPGILGLPNGASPYYLATTALSSSASTVDQVDLALRTEIRLYGTSSSCTEQVGQAFVTDLNSRIVGCRLAGGDAGAGACGSDSYVFIDSNAPQYHPGSGTFDSKQLPAAASCSDALAALL